MVYPAKLNRVRCYGVQYLLALDAERVPDFDTRVYRRASGDRRAYESNRVGGQEAQTAAPIAPRWFAAAQYMAFAVRVENAGEYLGQHGQPDWLPTYW